MSISHTISKTWSNGARTVNAARTFTDDAAISINTTVADSVTDQLVELAVNVSEIKAIIVKSTQAVTLETNNSSAPDETIVLIADEMLVWNTGSYYVNLFATDLTKIYLTNASGATATVSIEILYDPTP